MRSIVCCLLKGDMNDHQYTPIFHLCAIYFYLSLQNDFTPFPQVDTPLYAVLQLSPPKVCGALDDGIVPASLLKPAPYITVAQIKVA